YFLPLRPPPASTLFPYTTLFRSRNGFDLIGSYRTSGIGGQAFKQANYADMKSHGVELTLGGKILNKSDFKYSANLTFGYNKNKIDRKSTRLNSSHVKISYAVFCL